MEVKNIKVTELIVGKNGKLIESSGVDPKKKIVRIDRDNPNGHWEFPELLGTKGEFGFIYAIFDPELKKGYLGKKQFVGAGKLNKGVPSNWRTYTSSCKELQEQIRLRGLINFKFIAIEQYKVRGTLGYAEVWSQCYAETPTSNVWYNGLIEKVSWPVREMITQRHKERLQMVIDMVK